MSRVYVPATLHLLGDYRDAGQVPEHAERLVAVDDSEESEYDALLAAADASALLVGDVGRRVVVVAEVADVDAAFAMSEVVAVHVDTEALDLSGDPGDLPDLGWFATQEIGDLLV